MELVVDGSVMVLSGQLDVRCISVLREALYDQLESCSGDVALDVSGVESVDLPVLRMIAVASRMAARGGRRLMLRGCPAVVRRMLHLSHLRGLVEVEASASPATPPTTATA